MKDAIYSLGMNLGGQPPFYSSPDEMGAEIDKYIEHVKGEWHMEDKPGKNGGIFPTKVWDRYPEPITITGLCLFLGFESRQSFYDYEKREGFSYIIKKARMIVENGYEKRLSNDIPGSATGAIFALKNMGWKDQQEIDLNGQLKNEIDYSKLSDAALAEIASNRSR